VPTSSPTPSPTLVPTSTPIDVPTLAPTGTPTPAPTPVSPTAPGVESGVEVRPLQEVTAGQPPQIVEITDRDAVLVFESSLPLACSVVYGTTTGYGSIAVDQDMDGGAHTDHRPLLVGLEPDTEYHYRVQGAAPDGTLYVSEDATFRTAPAQERTETNLASLAAGARVVAVSSNFGGAADDGPWGANSALDGNRGTAWSSDGDGDGAFIEVELAGPARLSAVEVWTRTMSASAQIFRFTLTTDAHTGRGAEVLGPFTLPDATKAYRFEVDVTARSLRLDVVESNGGNTGLVEFAAYGTLAGE
jgi:hypothetical protein